MVTAFFNYKEYFFVILQRYQERGIFLDTNRNNKNPEVLILPGFII